VELEDGASISPFMEEYTHVLTGVTLSLTMTFPWDWNACEIPSDWSAGGSGSGGTGGGGVSLILKVNNVENNIQTILNLVQGANMTITDLGDGRVKFDATGDLGTNWGTIGGILADQIDLQSALNLKADTSSLADVAFSGDYGDLINTPTIPTLTSELTNDSGFITIADVPTQVQSDWNQTDSGEVDFIKNKPTIPDSSTFVPYTGATSNVNLGGNSFIADDGSDNSEMRATLFRVQNAAGTKYSYLDTTGLNVIDSDVGSSMNMNAGGLTFPDATSQSSAAVNADWNATSGLAEILNKPTLPPVIGDMLTSTYDTDVDGVVDSAERIQIVVRNSTGDTLRKGQVVYLSGATGNRPNAVLADASSEATSSKTIGLVIADIPDNSDGQIAVNGTLHDLDTSAFNEGDTLWLSETAGEVQANTPPAEPAHSVFIGYVARSHPNFGRIVIQIQNGYELNELHGVQITSETTGDILLYDGSLWVNQSLESNIVTNSSGVSGASVTDALDTLDANKVDANAPILSGTATKVVYDEKGLITSGGLLAASDIPFGVDAIRIGTGVVSNTEFGYLDGVNSSIQTQLNTLNSGKVTSNTPITPQTATKISYDAKGLVTGGGSLLPSDIPTGIPATSIGGGTIDNTEFGFLNGVTSNIQTQINGLSIPTLNTRGTAVAPVQVNAITATSCNLSLSLPSGTADRTYYIEACWAIQPSFNPTSGARVGFLWSGSIINFHGVYQGSQSEIEFRNGQVISLGNGTLFPSNTPYLANDITRNALSPTIFKGYCQVVAGSTTTLTLALAAVTLNQTISFSPRGSYLRAIRVN
jgi:hypothetical protein